MVSKLNDIKEDKLKIKVPFSKKIEKVQLQIFMLITNYFTPWPVNYYLLFLVTNIIYKSLFSKHASERSISCK